MDNRAYKEIKKCRICDNEDLFPVLDLGNQYLTGVFPKTKSEKIVSGPLCLVKCKKCHLLQLSHSYSSSDLYGINYGYRSNLNKSMLKHLEDISKLSLKYVNLTSKDIVLDIGSNDGSLLSFYPETSRLVGIDPTIKKFIKYYKDYIYTIPDLFSYKTFKQHFGSKKAKIITSIAMLYDLENPFDFMNQVHKTLDKDGIWISEQSYMPTMIEKVLYDTICQEHLEYYGLTQIKYMSDKIGFKIIDVKFNNINGGSFLIVFAKDTSSFHENLSTIDLICRTEKYKKFNTLEPYIDFKTKVFRHRLELQQTVSKIKNKGKLILGYGASTKGNVLLQFCKFTEKDIQAVAEVNKDKFGCYTPGTYIPIISEKKARAMRPDYFLVLPWHFKGNIIIREKEYLNLGGKLIFPLPVIEVVKNENYSRI